MALVVKDRVLETSITTGTGTFTLDGPELTYQSFAAIGNGNVAYYAIVSQTADEWEVGYGTYTASGTTLSRTFVYASSNSGNLVDFTAGTKNVFNTYPAEQAIYQELNGDLKLVGGVIGVTIDGTTGTTLPNTSFQAFTTGNYYMQANQQNLSSGAEASADWVITANNGDDTVNYTDLGMASSGYNYPDFSAVKANSTYLIGTGADVRIVAGKFGASSPGAQDIVFVAGSLKDTEERLRIKGATGNVILDGTNPTDTGEKLQVVGTAKITGATTFGSTVLLNTDPTLALQAATKQYVDNQVTAGLHIHAPVRVETTANLNATYAQGGTTFDVTDITGTDTVTTSVNHGLSVNDQIWLTSTAGNGLSINTAYFVYSTPALNQLTLSLTFGGAEITGLTNASGLTYATRANSGVGATLTNAGTQVALTVDGKALNVADRVMVRLQTNGAENGVYVVTTVGTGATNWVLTRATDSNMVNPSDPNGLGTGDYYFTQEGVLNAGDSHVLTTEPNTMIIGYTTLTYTQFSGGVTYSGGTNIDVTGQVISLTGTVATTNGGTGLSAYTAGDLIYSNATNTLTNLNIGTTGQTLIVAGGAPVWGALDMAGAGVAGVLPESHGGTNQASYATGDTLYASGTNTLAKLSGNTSTNKQFLSQTGTGSASAAPVWSVITASDIASGVLGAANGGTGLSSYSVGDIIYASGATTLSKLNAVATGNVLLSGGLTTAPSWGKVGLTTAVTGTLPIANGGTGQTTKAAAFNALSPITTTGDLIVGNGSNSATRLAIGSNNQVLTSNGTTATWATLSTVSTFSAGTTGFTPSTATSGAVTLAGTLATTNGGTGLTSFTSGGLLYASSTSALTTGSALTYSSSTLTAPNVAASNGMIVNSNTVSASYAIPSGSSALAAGPITVASGATVTVPSGSRWVIL